MIKHKGVCDVCTEEFELSEGTFAMRIVEDNMDHSGKRWTVTVLECLDDTPEGHFFHVCGMTCLYEAITAVIEKQTEECRFRIRGYQGADDSNIQVVDLIDKWAK